MIFWITLLVLPRLNIRSFAEYKCIAQLCHESFSCVTFFDLYDKLIVSYEKLHCFQYW